MMVTSMDPDRLRRIEELYHDARDRAPEERGAYLDRVCAGDEELRREIASLLDQSDSGPMENPAWKAAADLFDDRSASLARGATLGPYRIERRLGSGGMGDVDHARDPRLDRDVAIKIAHREFSGRFQREARAISALNHPS